ncbi:MAG: hypothetical protein ACJ8GW_11695 [Massilia sp.]
MLALNYFLRGLCLLTYGLALCAAPLGLSAQSILAVRALAVLLLVIHLIELPFVMPHVRRYRGPFGLSVLFTLLFGLLHWMPLRAGRSDKLRP